MLPIQISDSSTPDQAPWWGDAAVSGGFLVAGILLSFITTWITNTHTSKRDLARRFDNDIREAGSAFINKADEFYESDKEYRKLRKDSTAYTGDEVVLKKLRSDSHAKSRIAREALQPLSFVVPDALIGAARGHYVSILGFEFNGDTEEQTARYQKSRQEVVDQIRIALSLPASKIGKKKRFAALREKRARPYLLISTALVIALGGFWIGRIL